MWAYSSVQRNLNRKPLAFLRLASISLMLRNFVIRPRVLPILGEPSSAIEPNDDPLGFGYDL
jgi:hypothetical protein